MKVTSSLRFLAVSLALVVLGLSAACQAPASTTPSPSINPTLTTSPSPSPSTSTSPIPTLSYSQYQLAYLLLDKYPNFFWCDPDFYPIAREGQEQAKALSEYSSIRANEAEFSAILKHLNLATQADYQDSQKLDIYREHKKITVAIQLTSSAEGFRFSLAVGQGQGQRITGAINGSGVISVLSQVASFNTCPICLTQGTLIDTPQGQVSVERLQVGEMVWSSDSLGLRVAVPIVKTSRTPVPPGFQVVRLTLEDGRSLTASPNHPSSLARALGDYQVGEILDGARVIKVEQLAYLAEFTYDLLPSGQSGFYWAAGVLVGSTLGY